MYPQVFGSSNQDAIGNAIDKVGNPFATGWTASSGPSFIYSEFDCGCGITQIRVAFNTNPAIPQLRYRLASNAAVMMAASPITAALASYYLTTDLTIDALTASGACFAYISVRS